MPGGKNNKGGGYKIDMGGYKMIGEDSSDRSQRTPPPVEFIDMDLSKIDESILATVLVEKGNDMDEPILNLNGWRFMSLVDAMPVDEPYLVYLTEPMTGSQVHVAVDKKISNGTLRIVGSVMEGDAPDILLWRPMVELPGRTEA